ncbi:MAG: HAD-IIIA family hydrolase [Methylococcaceae bacterium]|nr:HAD-IIIA family hydrolase [Methylococcaceae bacterium]
MKNRFDLIIFDWDGTLADSVDWIVQSLQIAAKECDCPIPEYQATKSIIGLSIDKAMNILFPEADALITEQLIKCYRQAFYSKKMTQDDLFLGVNTMLQQLKQLGYTLAVATGKSRSGLDRALQATQTAELFSITRCADETASKPNPKMIEEIIQHTQITAERTLMVGDSTHDLKMAQNANVSAIGVSCGAHSESLLQQYQPLLCLKQTTELLEIMKG